MAEKEINGFNERLMLAISEMDNPTKSSKANVGKYSYNYETLEQLLGIINPALEKQGLAQTQRQSWNDDCNSFVLETVVFDATEERVMDTRPLPVQTDAQKAGSWETYMRRYALKSVFGLCGEDDDGQATKKPSKATASQLAAFEDLIGEFADIKGKSNDDVLNALLTCKTASANGVKCKRLEDLTERQAGELLGVMNTWVDKAQEEQVAAQEMADEDIPF